jgi:S-adenosylmethionine synthetase
MTDGAIHIEQRNAGFAAYDIVERKGRGHPDTLADQLAIRLSREYSRYTRDEFDAILHHNFDKVGLLGGHSRAEFADGELTAPLRVLLNGRASVSFGGEPIPTDDLLESVAHEFLTDRFPQLDPQTDIDVHNNLSAASSPGETEPDAFEEEGARAHWFTPRSLEDLPERDHLRSNDTSHGVAFAPLNPIESFVLELEQHLNGPYSERNEWLGSDIKLMCQRIDTEVNLTVAVPQIADYVPDLETYDANLEKIEADIRAFADDVIPSFDLSVYTNNRDDYEAGELYLTAIGSAIESGDEGLVGRGNRVNGLITPTRPMSIEGQCGKNPVYHVGMVYNLGARRVAQRLHREFGVGAEVHLISQTGRTLVDPWKTLVSVTESVDTETAEAVIADELEEIPKITEDWLAGDIEMV